jgi:hypothetical protein
MRLRHVVSALPFGVLITIAIGAASIGPEDAGSNLSKWAHWLVSHALPGEYVVRPDDYRTVAILAAVLSVIYAARFWGLPYLRSFSDKIPIEEAARLAYEAAERANALDLVDSSTLEPSRKLDHFKFAMLVDNEINLHGKRPPSTQSLPITREELSELYPVTGLNQLNYRTPFNRVAFTDVMISRKDLRALVRRYVPAAHNFRKRFGSC